MRTENILMLGQFVLILFLTFSFAFTIHIFQVFLERVKRQRQWRKALGDKWDHFEPRKD